MVNSYALVNTNKGFNTEYDVTSQISKLGFYGLNRNWYLLEYLYRQSWACRRIIDYYPDKMVKGWGFLGLDDNPELTDETKIEFNKLKKLYNQGQKTGNLLGDGYILRLVNDGRDVFEPINYDDVREIKYSRVLSPREVEPRINYDEHDYYNPEFFEVSTNNQPYQIYHCDRVIRFSGNYLTPDAFERNDYCYASILEPFYEPYIRMEQSIAHVANAMTSFEFILFGVEGLLEDLISGDPNALEKFQAKYKAIQQQMSSDRGIVHDLDLQKIQIAERKFTNIDNIIKEVFRQELIAASGLTKTQLYNEHPSGLNSTGKSELLNEANKVLEYQELKWRDNIDCDVRLIMAKHTISDGFYWNWKSTYQPTKEEEIEQRKTIAETDKIYSEMGAIMPEETRQRFEGTEFQEDLVLEGNLEPQQAQLEEKQDAVEKFKPVGNLIIESDFASIDVQQMGKYRGGITSHKIL